MYPRRGMMVYIWAVPSSPDYEYEYGIDIDVMNNPNNLSVDKWYAQYYTDQKNKAKDSPFFLSPKGDFDRLNDYSVYKTIDFGIDHENIYLSLVSHLKSHDHQIHYYLSHYLRKIYFTI